MAADSSASESASSGSVKDVLIELRSEKLESTAKVHRFGATVVSWEVRGSEQLFVSPLAKLDGAKAIRGGIPLVFPQFGPGLLKQHGFARDSWWTVLSVDNDCDNPTAILKLSDTEASREQWPHQFNLYYVVTLQSDSLRNVLVVENPSTDSPFEFTSLFHTYFRCANVSEVAIAGLEATDFVDKTKAESSQMTAATGEVLRGIHGETDRIYVDALATRSTLTATEGSRQIAICDTRGLRDIVVWNPWIAKAKRMSDFEDCAYPQMICIEAGTVLEPIALKPGQRTTLSQTIRLRTLLASEL